MDQVYRLAATTTGSQATGRRRGCGPRATPMALRSPEKYRLFTDPVSRSLGHVDSLQREMARLQLCVDDFVSAAPGGPWTARAMESGTDSDRSGASTGLPMACTPNPRSGDLES